MRGTQHWRPHWKCWLRSIESAPPNQAGTTRGPGQTRIVARGDQHVNQGLSLGGDQRTVAFFHGEDWIFRHAYRRETVAKESLPCRTRPWTSLCAGPKVRLVIGQKGNWLYRRNTSKTMALYPLLGPGEEASFQINLTPRLQRADTDFPHGRPAAGPLMVRVTGWNIEPLSLSWEEL